MKDLSAILLMMEGPVMKLLVAKGINAKVQMVEGLK